MIRKAGELIKAHPMTTALVGGGSILGIAGTLKALSKPEQDAVVDAAIAAEQDKGDGTVLGVSSASLLAAAALVGMTDGDEDLLTRVSTRPGMSGETDDIYRYTDPMGDRRYDAIEKGQHRIHAPLPRNVMLIRR